MNALDDLAALTIATVALAEEAGRAAMAFYGDRTHREKSDGSPVTAADEAADRIITAGLLALAPGIPIVSEEGDHSQISGPDRPSIFWLVDPLDGTKEFLAGNGEFTVNIALIIDASPRLGVVVAPALGDTYAAHGPGTATRTIAGVKRPISVRTVPKHGPESGLTVVGSRSHGDAAGLEKLLAGMTVAATITAGSSLKLCLVARGDADLYPRLGTTMEWDIAAGHAVLIGAGGRVDTLGGTPLAPGGTPLALGGTPLAYGKPDYRNPHFIAASPSAMERPPA